jgi:hypothetical protein
MHEKCRTSYRGTDRIVNLYYRDLPPRGRRELLIEQRGVLLRGWRS